MKKLFSKSTLLAIAVTLVLAGIWELLTITGIVSSFFISQPSKIITDFWLIVSSGLIFPHIGITLIETFLGLLFGTIAGILVAFILDRSRLLDKAFNPIFTALNGLPKMALAPLFILIFGIGMTSKVFLSGLMVFFLILFNTYGGLKSIDSVLIETIKLMNGNSVQVIRKVAIPSCMPWIFAGLQSGIGMSLGGAIIGEYMGASRGLGWMIFTAGSMFNMTRLMACLIVMVIVLMLLYAGMSFLKTHYLRWQPSVSVQN
jgi:NitT/TauT family transport system permease protein